jgi:hypothetical protein
MLECNFWTSSLVVVIAGKGRKWRAMTASRKRFGACEEGDMWKDEDFDLSFEPLIRLIRKAEAGI